MKYRKMHPWETVQVLHPDDENHGLEPFPKDTKVYHFHPNAFVEQMRRTRTCCLSRMQSDDLKFIAYKSKKENISKYLTGINKALEGYHIDSCLRKVHFLAQVLHESAALSATREIGVSDNSYGGYPGRGLIQLTGSSNYLAYQNFSGEDVTSLNNNKKKLEENPHAATSAGWFWSQKAKLNEIADQNDFIYITAKINGGFNGYNDRLSYFNKGFKYYKNACLSFKGFNNDFTFDKSKVFHNVVYSFAWGLWHDTETNKEGCAKNNTLAIEGYQRVIELTSEDYSKKNIYGIHNLVIFETIKDSNGNVFVRSAAIKRINDLNT